MATSTTLKRSPLTPSTMSPPSLNRQHSYNSRPDASNTSSNATTVLANLRTRSMSPPGRQSTTSNGSPRTSPVSTPLESPQMERRTSWEDCRQQRDGYISFPDFDQLVAQKEQYANRQ